MSQHTSNISINTEFNDLSFFELAINHIDLGYYYFSFTYYNSIVNTINDLLGIQKCIKSIKIRQVRGSGR